MKRGKQETKTSSISEQVSAGQKRMRGTSESPEISEAEDDLELESGESEESFNAENIDKNDEEI